MNKAQEREHFERFAEAAGMPELKAAIDSEEPDFILNSRGLGVELALFLGDNAKHGGSAAMKTNAARWRFRMLVNKALDAHGFNPALGVTVDWRSEALNGPPQQAAAEFLTVVQLGSQQLAADSDLEPVWEAGNGTEPELAKVADAVRLKRFPPDVKRSLFLAPASFWAVGEIPKAVDDLIREKEAKRAGSYSKKCAKNWLVLVAAGDVVGSFVDLQNFNKSGISPNGFERIYILDIVASGAVQVQ